MINKEELSKHVSIISYDIIDNIISPMCGINGVIADLYLASIEDYTYENKEIKKIFQLISKKYNLKIDCGYFCSTPIALLALYIMENSDYFKNHYKPRKT